MFNSVLLPAPFSPINAWISPAQTSKPTLSSARTPGYSTPMSRSSTTGRPTSFGAGIRCSVLALCEDVRGHAGGVEHRLGRLDALGNLLAARDLFDRVEKDRADQRVALDGAIRRAVENRLEHIANAIDGHHQH